MSEVAAPGPSELLADRYVLEEQVHSGGMSRVFRARDTTNGEVVAVKRPARDDPQTLTRFAEEGEILASLSHPAIVRAISRGGSTFVDAHIATEWLDGETLAHCLVAGPLTLLDAVSVVRRAAEALAMVHRSKITHRDLKPANLVLCGGSAMHTKLIDFGIARRETARGLVVHSSFAGGTWAYMSPEQAMGSAELGARADIYSLGCVLFEAVSGSPAFPGDRAGALVAKVWQPPPNLTDLCEDVPKPLAQLVLKMLATDPLGRQRDAGVLVTELLALGKLPERAAKRRT
ncbi:MAG TPA: serine/threonine-protein kinase [Polyangiaceae bacterium]|jgi:serine/threonine protein kinase